eukprot:535771_1
MDTVEKPSATETIPILEEEVKQNSLEPPPKLTRSRTNTQLPEIKDDNINVVSFNRDIYNTFIILMAYGSWDKMLPKDKRNFKLMVFGCALLQFCTLFFLLLELLMYPPWEVQDEHTGFKRSNLLVITTKMLALMCFSVYIGKEYSASQTVYFGIRNNQKARGFKQDGFEHKGVKSFNHFIFGFSIVVHLIAVTLSIALISSASTGFDAVLNAVGITFVLDIDDWLYGFVKSHRYVEDKLFDIEYELEPSPTFWYSVNRSSYGMWMAWISFASTLKCIHHCVPKIDLEVKFWSPPVSRKCRSFFLCSLVSLTAAFIFLGFTYQESDLSGIGYGIISLVLGGYTLYFVCVCAVMCFCGICFTRYNNAGLRRFWDHDADNIYNKYKDNLKNAKNGQRGIIEREFINECIDTSGLWFNTARGNKARLNQFINLKESDNNNKNPLYESAV